MFRLRVDDDIELGLPEERDAETVFALIDANREFIGRYLGWTDDSRAAEDTRQWLRRARHEFAAGDQVSGRIWHRGAFAGVASLTLRNRHNRLGEIGYWLGEAFTGQGIATRAVRALVDYGFRAWDLHRIVIRCATDNPKSGAIPRRLGFVKEAVLRDAARLRERYVTFELYAMLADDWHALDADPYFSVPVDAELSLRLMEPRHAEALHTLLINNRDHVGRWEGWVENGSSYASMLSFTHSFLRRWADGRGFAAGLYARRDGLSLPAGNVTYRVEDHDSVELGYWLAESCTGRGYVTRVVRALLDHALIESGLSRAELVISAGNIRSLAVAERLGFRQEAILREEELLHGRHVDRAVYGLLAAEWLEKRGAP